jgi:RNA polymerase sigma-70 factor (ECF subfamily)
LLHRARQHVRGTPRYAPSADAQRELLQRFLSAAEAGDLGQLESMLKADVVSWGDGGGKVAASPRPIVGRTAVARFFARVAQLRPPDSTLELRDINGAPGLLVRYGNGDVGFALTCDADQDGISAIRVVVNPDKLSHLRQL